MHSDPHSLIGDEHAALIEHRVSIMVGSRDAGLRPHLLRAVGCRLSADRRRATLLVPERSSGEVLSDLRDNGRIAVVFSQPTSNRTLQLKGNDASIAPCGPHDAALAERSRGRGHCLWLGRRAAHRRHGRWPDRGDRGSSLYCGGSDGGY